MGDVKVWMFGFPPLHRSTFLDLQDSYYLSSSMRLNEISSLFVGLCILPSWAIFLIDLTYVLSILVKLKSTHFDRRATCRRAHNSLRRLAFSPLSPLSSLRYPPPLAEHEAFRRNRNLPNCLVILPLILQWRITVEQRMPLKALSL